MSLKKVKPQSIYVQHVLDIFDLPIDYSCVYKT